MMDFAPFEALKKILQNRREIYWDESELEWEGYIQFHWIEITFFPTYFNYTVILVWWLNNVAMLIKKYFIYLSIFSDLETFLDFKAFFLDLRVAVVFFEGVVRFHHAILPTPNFKPILMEILGYT